MVVFAPITTISLLGWKCSLSTWVDKVSSSSLKLVTAKDGMHTFRAGGLALISEWFSRGVYYRVF